jgi:hypothetical protein
MTDGFEIRDGGCIARLLGNRDKGPVPAFPPRAYQGIWHIPFSGDCQTLRFTSRVRNHRPLGRYKLRGWLRNVPFNALCALRDNDCYVGSRAASAKAGIS